MRISAVHIYHHELPVTGSGSFRLARTRVTSLDSTIVEIATDTGLHGFGETCPLGPAYQPHHALGARAALTEIAPHLLGLDALAIGPLTHVMDQRLGGHGYAKAAVDIALWDLAGKAYGARVCDLLGGAFTERVPSYYSVAVTEPAQAARIAGERQAEGYRRLQIKVGGRHVAEDIDTIRAVCAVIDPDVALAIDANRGWTTRDAITVSQACRDLRFVLEQPCATLDEIAVLRPQVRHPVHLDESSADLSTVAQILAGGLADGLGLKVTRVGGLSAMRAIRDLCAARNVPITSDDAWGGDIIAAACVHLGATVEPRLFDGTWIAAPYIDGHDDRGGGIEVRGGHLQVPSGPGLGIDPDRGRWGPAVASFG